MFSPDFDRLTTAGVLTALGHAAFTLSIGIGVLMAYGSYLPKNINIAKTGMTIAVLDTCVALLAGLAIFPLVFANGLEPGGGLAIWFIGIGTVLSFNVWENWHPLGFITLFADKTVFDLLDFLVSNLMMPLGGLAIALFAGWAMKREGLPSDIGLEGGAFRAFMFVLRYLTPAGIAVVFLYNLA